MKASPDDDESQRLCAVTRQRLPQSQLLRFVAGPDGALVPDVARKLPGRGVSVGASVKLVREAVRRKVFSHALKQDVTIPDGLDSLVDRLLERQALQMLSMVNKAGLAVTGFEKVREALFKGGAAGLIEASDGAADGREKLEKAARAAAAGEKAIPVISLFTGEQLSLALGRENAIHALVRAGPASAAFVERCRFLADFRSGAEPGQSAQAVKNSSKQSEEQAVTGSNER